MSGVAREAGTARRRLTPIAGVGRLDRLSLIALGRRHLVRARHTQHGCSVVELYREPGVSGLWLVAVAAGRSLVPAPVAEATTVQLLQGRLRMQRDDTGPAVLPGDIVLGPMPADQFVAVTDAVLVLTGTPLASRPVSV